MVYRTITQHFDCSCWHEIHVCEYWYLSNICEQ